MRTKKTKAASCAALVLGVDLTKCPTTSAVKTDRLAHPDAEPDQWFPMHAAAKTKLLLITQLHVNVAPCK